VENVSQRRRYFLIFVRRYHPPPSADWKKLCLSLRNVFYFLFRFFYFVYRVSPLSAIYIRSIVITASTTQYNNNTIYTHRRPFSVFAYVRQYYTFGFIFTYNTSYFGLYEFVRVNICSYEIYRVWRVKREWNICTFPRRVARIASVVGRTDGIVVNASSISISRRVKYAHEKSTWQQKTTNSFRVKSNDFFI